MTFKIELNRKGDDKNEKLERIKEAESDKKSAEESFEDATERLWQTCKFTDQERELFELAVRSYIIGEVSRISTGKVTKKEVIEMGRIVKRKQEEEARLERVEETKRTKPENYRVVTDEAGLERMLNRLREEVRRQQNDEWFQSVFELFNNTEIRRKLKERGIDIPAVKSLTVWDTETTGTDTFNDLTGGYSVWLPLLNEGYYVAYGHLTGEQQVPRSKALKTIEKFMSLPEHVKSFHNAEFDLAMFLNDSLSCNGFRYDSMDAQKILYDHEESYGLKPLFTKYKKHIAERIPRAAEIDDFDFEDLFGKDSPMKNEIEVVGIYAIKDVEKGWYLTKWQIDMLREVDDLYKPYFEIRQYLPEVNVNIERTGFEVDLDGLKQLERSYSAELERLKNQLFETYGIDDDFLYEMSMALKGDKIKEWQRKQEERIRKRKEMTEKTKKELEKTNPETKKYRQLKERLEKYENNPLSEPIPQNAPDYIHEFNLSSNDHLAYLIYDVLEIKDRTKELAPKKKVQERAVSTEVLEVYFEEEESLKPLSDVSKYEKLLGTYIEKIPHALEADNRLHTALKTVSTGRYGSAGYKGKPNDIRPDKITDDNYLNVIQELVNTKSTVQKGTNLQNIPARTEEGLAIRKCFIPRDGYIFVGSDLSSIEPRIQAHKMEVEYNDSNFAELYRQGLDPYVELASTLFEVDKEVCKEDYYKSVKGTEDEVLPYRKITKQLFLAIGYGQAFEQFYQGVKTYGINEVQALKAYKNFDEILPGFKKMVFDTYEFLRKYGYTSTIYGQKRRFPDYKQNYQRLQFIMKRASIESKEDPELKKKAYKLPKDLLDEFWTLMKKTGRDERSSFNHTIQGSSANLLQLCMIRLFYEGQKHGWEFNLTLHDEVKSSVPLSQLTSEVIDLYNDVMTNTTGLTVPLKSDTIIETRWMEEYEKDEWNFKNQKPKEEE